MINQAPQTVPPSIAGELLELAVADASDSIWDERDYDAILRHRLLAPATIFDPADSDLDTAFTLTLESLLGIESPSLPALLQTIEWSREQAANESGIGLPADVATLICTAALAAAMVHHRHRAIRGMDDDVLARCFAWGASVPWGCATTSELCKRAFVAIDPSADVSKVQCGSNAITRDALIATRSGGRFDARTDPQLLIIEELPFISGYRVTAKLGEGGMATVWRATQLSTGRDVALKILPQTAAATRRARLRFSQEVQLAARLQNPGIARVYDSGFDNGVLYYAMELVQPGTHIDRFVLDQGLPQRDVLWLFLEVCRSIEYAHRHGVLHRDLKPSNVVIDADGHARVLDFGLAKALDNASPAGVTVDGHLSGTLEFMAPEQVALNSDQLDTRTDVYGLGSTLFLLLTGLTAREMTGSRSDVVRRISRNEVRRPRSLLPSLDVELESLLLKALDTEPDQRYGSAADLAAEIEDYLDGKPLTARPHSRVYVIRKWLRRHWAATAIACVVLMLVLSTLAVLLISNARLVRQRDATDAALLGEREARQAALHNMELASSNERLAQRNLYSGMIAVGDGFMANGSQLAARREFDKAMTLAGKLGESDLAATTGLLVSYRSSPPPLIGNELPLRRLGERFHHDAGRVAAIAIAPDGRRAITAGVEPGIKLWDLRTGMLIRTLADSLTPVSSLVWRDGGSSGTIVLSGHEDGTIRQWDVGNGCASRELPGHTSTVTSIDVSADCHTMLSGSADGTVRLWNLDTAEQIRIVGSHTGRINSVALSSDNRTALSGGADYHMKHWELSTGKVLHDFNVETTTVLCVRFCPDGETAISGNGDQFLRVWDLSSGTMLKTIAGHSASTWSLDFLPDKRRFVTANWDHSVRLFDMESGECERLVGEHDAEVVTSAVSPTGMIALTGGADGALKIWSLTERYDGVIFRDQKPVKIVAFAHDGRTAVCASSDHAVSLVDLATGRLLRRLTGHTGNVMSLAVTPDGETIASASIDGTIRAWQAEDSYASPQILVDEISPERLTQTGQLDGFPARSVENLRAVWGIACSNDGRILASASADGAIRIWQRTGTGATAAYQLRDRLTGHPGRALCVSMSPDGRFALSGGDQQMLRLWDVQTGKVIQTLKGNSPFVRAVALNADGTTAISGGHDQDVKLWDFTNRRPPQDVTRHSGLVKSIAFFPTGQFFMSAGGDFSARMTDLSSGQTVRSFGTGSVEINGLAISPDGRSFLTGDESGAVALWRLDQVQDYLRQEQIICDARHSLEIDPNDPASLAALAKWHASRGVHDWAVKLLEEASATGTKTLSLEMAQSYWQLGRFDDARREFQFAIDQSAAPVGFLKLCRDAVDRDSLGRR